MPLTPINEPPTLILVTYTSRPAFNYFEVDILQACQTSTLHRSHRIFTPNIPIVSRVLQAFSGVSRLRHPLRLVIKSR
jgi:hypothetical protein